MKPLRLRLGAAAFAIAGVLFAVYPALRPYSDETSMQGARAFGSTAWLVSHMFAMVGFTLLTVGLLGLFSALQNTRVENISFWALVSGLLGVGLTLPFYGGEAFGLHAIGQEALRQNSPALIKLAQVIRGDPQDIMFAIGLLLIAVSGIVAALAVWRSGTMPEWSGVPFAVAFALYLPQFFGPPVLRVAHGLLVTVGCAWLALTLWQHSGSKNKSN